MFLTFNLSLILEQNQNQKKKGKKKISQTNVKPLFILQKRKTMQVQTQDQELTIKIIHCSGSEVSLKQGRGKKELSACNSKKKYLLTN